MQRKLYFEHVNIGDELTSSTRLTLERTQLARYAVGVGDFNPLFFDEPYARQQGLVSVMAPNSLALGLFGQLLMEWSKGCRIRSLSAKFLKLYWPMDQLLARGRVVQKTTEDAEHLVEVSGWVENQKGEMVLRSKAVVQLFLNLEEENRHRAGMPPLGN